MSIRSKFSHIHRPNDPTLSFVPSPISSRCFRYFANSFNHGSNTCLTSKGFAIIPIIASRILLTGEHGDRTHRLVRAIASYTNLLSSCPYPTSPSGMNEE